MLSPACFCRVASARVVNGVYSPQPAVVCRLAGARLTDPVGATVHTAQLGPYCKTHGEEGKWRKEDEGRNSFETGKKPETAKRHFKECIYMASIAQLAEHALRKRTVVGSIPTGGFLAGSTRVRRCDDTGVP